MSSKIRNLLLEFETDEVGKLARTNDKSKKELVKAFTDPSDIVRERALLASIDLADPEVITDVTKALSDDVADVRIAAAQALAFYHQPRTIPVMIKGLKDSNTWVRSHCAAGLSKLLNGPIWARLSEEDIDRFVEDFPEMIDDDINKFLAGIKMKDSAISRFMNWRTKGFDIELDMSALVEELEGAPILISEDAIAVADVTKTGGVSDEIDEILSELPDDLLATLPPEDIKRLTPASARELVQKLQVSIPSSKPKKKKVKVRKVKKVKKKKKDSAVEELIARLPDEVRQDIGDETLASLSTEELEALLAATPEKEEPEVVEPEVEEELIDPRKQSLIDKYGEEKAELLITIPEVMLEGIPEEQIEEMDLDTLKGLTQALEPRD